jgi:ABC-2 type transport system ATP-binding protein
MVFLDEPTSGVDPVSRRRFWDMIYHIADTGTTVLVTTHYMDEAEQFDRMVFIHRGRLIATGTPDQLKAAHFNARQWSVECAPLAKAADTLRDAAFVQDISIPGNLLRITTKPDFDDAEKIRRMLNDNGVSVRGVHPSEPSLEDVFVHLSETLERQDREVRA